MFVNVMKFLWLLLMIISYLSAVHSKGGSKYYRAAVVEHVRFGNLSHTPLEILKVNFRTYETAVRTAAKNNADIIVFPEWGLYPHNKKTRTWVKNFAEDIPDPKKEVSNPCSQSDLFQDRPILKKLSCLAYQNRIFLVANMADTKRCSNRGQCSADKIESCSDIYIDCPEDETLYHNTNVVFDRQGTLIARYYKRHLYFEHDMNVPTNLEDIFFDTDFGTFTTFVCFDLVFKETVETIEKYGVINVAYPTYWYDFAPFTHLANSYQQAWAIRNKVNLLAANVHFPGTGTIGSGIYSAEKGALIYSNYPDGRSKILIADVPRYIDDSPESLKDVNATQFFIENGSAVEAENEDEKDFKHVKCLDPQDAVNATVTDYNCFQLDNSLYNFVKLKEDEGIVKQCMDNFCCHLSYKAISMDEDYYLGVFSGDFLALKSFLYGVETCFLTRCDSSDNGFCTNYVTTSKTVFQHVDIRGNFTAKHVYPSVLNSGIRLTDKRQWLFDGKSQITYHNLNKMNSLLFLGLSGRHYHRDETIEH